ncbi:MAG: DUF378 domain-containing protein [Clostridiales bacterium]|nr:DUF378 domain-containing protein [Clostridiales bacterium]
MQQQSTLDKISLTIVIIGAINWLLVGLFQFDLVASLLGGSSSIVSRTVYSIVGLAGLLAINLFMHNSNTALNHSQI